ncbi:hypothetical protein DL93DRAFT_2100737 [Clavulina sp. PMI_390]|nr:hypothetical protein DL93DRAFT_2100737 [Clavulina sp. PMI_390]
MMLFNATLLIPLILTASQRDDPHYLLPSLQRAESLWLPTPIGHRISLSIVDNPAYVGLTDDQAMAELARNVESDLTLPDDVEEGIPFTTGVLIIDDVYMKDGYVKAIGFDEEPGWDVYALPPSPPPPQVVGVEEVAANVAAEEEHVAGSGWTEDIHVSKLHEIPGIFSLDQRLPTIEVFQDRSQLPLHKIHDAVGPQCLYWYLTSHGQKIGQFEPQELGSVVWQDSDGKEVITAFMGQTCGPNPGEPMSPPEKLTITKRPTSS